MLVKKKILDNWVHLEKRVLLKRVHRLVIVARFITGHEQTQFNRVCFFISLVYFLLSKDLTVQRLVTYCLLSQLLQFKLVMISDEFPFGRPEQYCCKKIRAWVHTIFPYFFSTC